MMIKTSKIAKILKILKTFYAIKSFKPRIMFEVIWIYRRDTIWSVSDPIAARSRSGWNALSEMICIASKGNCILTSWRETVAGVGHV